MKKGLSLLLAIVLIAGSLAGCADGGSGSKTAFRSLYSSDVSTLNYLNTTTTNDMGIPANSQECLIQYDTLGNVQPALATEWTTSEDNLTWTFKLRQGVKWVNYKGEEVGELKAKDFVAAAEYALNVNADGAYMYEEAMVSGAAAVLAEEGAFDQVGVRAVDDYTLEFTLANPCPYFLTCLTYGCFTPISEECLRQVGDWDSRASWAKEDWDAFSEKLDGIDYTQLWYCGAYYLSIYAPGERYTLTKNDKYWDKDQVYITTIESTYNKESATISAEMYLRGELEDASITSTMAKSWLEDSEKAGYVHPKRITPSYSYFFSFNFDPQFDAEYEPDNWKLAVNNENFRKSILYGMNRLGATKISDEANAEALLQNTITPVDFCAVNGVDYTQIESLTSLRINDSSVKDAFFNEETALGYKEAAIKELTADGASFPVKVLMTYNPNVADWDAECLYIKQQLEGLLGTDYIEVIVDQGPTTDFLSTVRRGGQYALLKTNWGCDYADPLTWAAPFDDSNSYGKMYLSEDPDTKALVDEYYKLIEAANAYVSVDELQQRYEAFAKAEAFLIEHALAVPFGVSGGYTASYLNPFEGQYAPYGVATLRYKGQKILEKPMSTQDFQAAYTKWQEDRAASGNK